LRLRQQQLGLLEHALGLPGLFPGSAGGLFRLFSLAFGQT
jgi:hypothetical protein